MCALATKDVAPTDVIAALEWTERREGCKKVVLVGLSSGGELSQLILSKGLAKVQGVGLVTAIPSFGL